MERMGVLIQPRPENPFGNWADFNPAVIVHQGSIFIYDRQTSKTDKFRSTIGLNIFDLNHQLEHRQETPIIRDSGVVGYEDPRAVKLTIDGREQIVLAFTEAIKIEDGWRINIDIACSDNGYDFQILQPNMPGRDCNKDGVLFPRKINGKYYMLHRIWPDMCLACSDDLMNWQNLGPIMKPIPKTLQSSYIGGGAPPIEEPDGWLVFYHGVPRYRYYSAFAALLDLHDPTRVLARTIDPLLIPEMEYEKYGWVRNVVFVTGALKFGDNYRIYYGAADTCVACAEFTKSEVFSKLRPITSAPLY